MGQKITIDNVTRIEGHARVTIHLDDDGKVERSYLHIDQFRGFEKFSEGRMYFEMPVIWPRPKRAIVWPAWNRLALRTSCANSSIWGRSSNRTRCTFSTSPRPISFWGLMRTLPSATWWALSR